MKKITPNQRTLNIFNKAIANGFEFEEQDTIENTRINAENFLIENEIDVIEEEVEVKTLGNHGQRVDWSDGKGFEFWSQGEIVDLKGVNPGTKVYHNTIVDSEANVIKMYYLAPIPATSNRFKTWAAEISKDWGGDYKANATEDALIINLNAEEVARIDYNNGRYTVTGTDKEVVEQLEYMVTR